MYLNYAVKKELIILQKTADISVQFFRTRGKLIDALKCVNVTLQSYLRQIPNCGGIVYSKTIKEAVQFGRTVMLLTDLMNYETRKSLDDLRRLSTFASSLNGELRMLRKRKIDGNKSKQTIVNKPKKIEKVKTAEKRPNNLELFRILARKKFGSPQPENSESQEPKPTVTKVNSRKSSKTIIPRETKLTRDRSQFSRLKMRGTTPTDYDVKSSCFSNLLTDDDDATFKSAKSKSEQNVSYLPTVQKVIRKRNVESERQLFVDISDDELESILDNKSNFEREKKDRELMSTRYFKIDTDKVVENVSKEIVEGLVFKVCHEILDSNLIAQLIRLEMKD